MTAGIVAVVVAILSLIGNLVGSFMGNSKTQALIAYRVTLIEARIEKIENKLDAIETKTDKHNQVIERTYSLEEDNAVNKKNIAELKDDIKFIKRRLPSE